MGRSGEIAGRFRSTAEQSRPPERAPALQRGESASGFRKAADLRVSVPAPGTWQPPRLTARRIPTACDRSELLAACRQEPAQVASFAQSL